MKTPDLARMTEVMQRLDEICREAEALRLKVQTLASEAPVYPDLRESAFATEFDTAADRAARHRADDSLDD